MNVFAICIALSLAAAHQAAPATAPPPSSQPAPPGKGDGAEESIADLIARLDPTAQINASEALHEAAEQQLRSLIEKVSGEAELNQELADQYFHPDCQLQSPTPTTGVERIIPSVRFRQLEGTEIPQETATALALMHQLRIWRGVDPKGRFELSTVSITPLVSDRFETTMLVQGYNADSARAVQRNGIWKIGWHKPATEALPRIDSLQALRYAEIRLTGLQLLDGTDRVLGSLASHPAVVHGGDHWFGRLDILGELNYWGHEGIAIGDVNGDDRDDLYVGMGNGVPNLLLVQQEDGSVVNKAAQAGVDWLDSTKGVLLVDMDNDGDQDLLAAIGPAIVIMTNDGQGIFTPARSLQSASAAPFYSLAVADYDQDGDLDIYGCRYLEGMYGVSVPLPVYDAGNGPSNHLLRNDGASGYVDATRLAGMSADNARMSLAATWVDYDGDGDLDLYVVNDFGPNNLYRQEDVASGRFVDVARDAGLADQAAGTGASWSDFDLDGDLDLYVSNVFSAAGQRITALKGFLPAASDQQKRHIRSLSQGSSLLVNQGNGSFVNPADHAGTRHGHWAWGSRFVDLNGDGYDDLVVPNGFLTNVQHSDVSTHFWRDVVPQSPLAESVPTGDSPPVEYSKAWLTLMQSVERGASWAGRQRNNYFVNLGDGRFMDASAVSQADWPDDGRAVAVADWDADGRLDLWFKNRTSPTLRFAYNNSTPGSWLALRLEGAKCNRDAIGARVTVKVGDTTLTKMLFAGDGFLSQSSKWLHFGLGGATAVRDVVVHWPGGDSQPLGPLAVNKRYHIKQDEEPQALPPRAPFAPQRAASTTQPAEPSGRVVLRAPLPLPPTTLEELFPSEEQPQVRLLCLWAEYNAASIEGLAAIAQAYDQLHAKGLRAVALNPDSTADQQATAAAFEKAIGRHFNERKFNSVSASPASIATFEAVLRNVLGRSTPPTPPASLLIDQQGRLQVLYLANSPVSQLENDLQGFGNADAPLDRIRTFEGRWFYQLPRNYGALSLDLAGQGYIQESLFFRQLEIQAQLQKRLGEN